jgi:DNA-binding MarR family transcriptional regulator
MTDLDLAHLIHHTSIIFKRSHHDITGGDTQYPPESGKILMVLDKYGIMTQTELASKLHIRPQSLTDSIVKLEEQGYVIRTRDENDKRELNVQITETGRETGHKIHQLHEETAHKIFSCLSDEEKEAAGTILKKVLDNYDKVKGGDAGV